MTAFEKFPKDGFAYSAADVGFALAGLIRRDAGVLKVGMLVAPSVDAVAASWKVEVGPFWRVGSTLGSITFSGLSAAEQVDIEPATDIPAGQGRIDRICWDPVAEALVVVPGVVSASPVAPTVATGERVAQVRVNAGDGMVVAARVTPEFLKTGLIGQVDDVPWTNTPLAAVSGAPRSRYRMVDDVVEIIGRGRKSAGGYSMFQLPSAMRFSSGALRFAAEGGREIEITANGWVACTDRNAADITFNIKFPRV